MPETRRHDETRTVARANRVTAVIRLCSGKIDDWADFLRNTNADELLQEDRRRLRFEATEAKSRTKKLVDGFNRFFFDGATGRL
jgi:hypothetical protein